MIEHISVTILVKNVGEHLRETLKSLADFREVLVLDTGSTDNTIEIAKEFPNVRLQAADFKGFGETHNYASSLTSNDWILSIDGDEVLTKELVDEISKLKLQNDSVYAISRHNYFNGKHIKGCSGWYPDWIVRLYNRKVTSFTPIPVHEKIQDKGFKIIRLKNPFLHTPYRTISDFLNKMQLYSNLFAVQNSEKKSSLFKALSHGFYAFFKSYFLKRGIFQGKEGFIISLYNGHVSFYKYLKISDLGKC